MGIQWVTGWTCLHYLCEQIARVFTGLPCYLGKDTWKRKTLKDRVTKDHDGEPERRVSFTEEAAKILHKMPASRVPSYTAKTMCHVCVRFKWWRQRNLSMHSPHPRFKGSFANAGRASGKIPHTFTIKSPCHRKEFAVSLGWLGTLSKIPTLNAVFLMVKSWTLESRVRQGVAISLKWMPIMLDVLGTVPAVERGWEIRGIKIGKEWNWHYLEMIWLSV